MFDFKFSGIETANPTIRTLAIWELTAFFSQDASLDDLEIDRENATSWYITNIIDRDLRDGYFEEQQAAEDEMLEFLSSSIKGLVKERSVVLGDDYPLILGVDGRLRRKDHQALSVIGGGYLALQFFRVWADKAVEIDEVDAHQRKLAENSFNKNFRAMFEILASYAVSCRRNGTPHMTSSCRDARHLHVLLTRLCRNVHSGRVKNFDEWNIAQKAANDGGVDCIVHEGGPAMPGDANFVLVGATVQVGSIDEKIMGAEKRQKFSDFFSERPAVLHGALVRPFEADELTSLKCKLADCYYITYDDIWRNLSRRPKTAYHQRYFRILDRQMRKLLKELLGVKLISDFDVYELKVG